jgi:hypothetical protein
MEIPIYANLSSHLIILLVVFHPASLHISCPLTDDAVLPYCHHRLSPKMAGPQRNLLWIGYEGSTGKHPSQLRSALRQHVMLNFFAQKAPQDQREIATCRRPLPRENTNSADRGLLEWLACPKPTPALVRDRDQLVFRAAWWHCYTDPRLSEPITDVPGWQQDCKRTWNAGFWQLARLDETLLEVFMGFAAAKEAVIKCLPDAPAYYRHKGKALTLLAKDIESKSI